MDFFEIILKRYSVRAYLDKPVEEEKLRKIMGAGLHSPSAHHRQPYQVFVAKDKELREKIVKANHPINFWLKEAPVIMVLCLDKKAIPEAKEDAWGYIDAGIMLENMMLASAALGLGSCACAAFDADKIRKVLALADDLTPVICLPIGYPREDKKGLIDFSKSYEKMAHFLTHYKEKKIEDIFIIK